MAKIIIRRRELPKLREDEVTDSEGFLNNEKFTRLAKFGIEYEVTVDGLAKSIVYSIPRHKTVGMGDPDIYPVIKQFCFHQKEPNGNIISSSRRYIGENIETYGFSLEDAETKANKLARETASYFAGRIPKGDIVEIEDKTITHISKIEETLNEKEHKINYPSAMWDEQPGA